MLDQLKSIINSNQIDELTSFVNLHRADLFSTPNIKDYSDLLKPIAFTDSDAILTVCWLSLLSGDNMSLFTKAMQIDPLSLDQQSKSFYHQLQALSGLFGDRKNRLAFSEEAIKELGDKDQSFYLANAYLTHGQILVGFQRTREASEYFYKAYQIFLKNEMFFPASISLTNALINWFKLGEVNKVIQIGEQALMMSSSFKTDAFDYWDVITLPIGMCYAELDRLPLALDYLIRANKVIDQMNLIHMHGYPEIYLMRVYTLLNDQTQLSEITNKSEKLFSTMHYPMMQAIIIYGKMLLGKLTKVDIEKFEVLFQNDQTHNPFIIETISVLYNKNLTKFPSIDVMGKYIDDARFEGNHVGLQMLLLLTAERYYQEKNNKAAIVLIEEAVVMYHKYQFKSAFYLYPFTCFSLFTKIDKSLKPRVIDSDLMTSKELEILMLIAQGKTNEEIGDTLFISIGTVKWHINHILSKLDVKNRLQAIDKAKKLNIL